MKRSLSWRMPMLLLILRFCEKPYSISRTLDFIISFFTLSFRTNTHLYLTRITLSHVWTIGPNTSYFTHEFSSIWIPHWPIISTSTFFNGLWFKFTIIAFGNVKSKYVVNNNFFFLSHISHILNNRSRSHNFRYLFFFKRFHSRG